MPFLKSRALCGEFECLRGRGVPGDDEAYPKLRKVWEAKMGAAGWLGIDWPEEFGGIGASEKDVSFGAKAILNPEPGLISQMLKPKRDWKTDTGSLMVRKFGHLWP